MRSRGPATRAILVAGLLLFVLALLGGCSTYSAQLETLRPDLAAGNYEQALATVEENVDGKDEVLRHLERGTILHFSDRWMESNEAFAEAELLADAIYKTSLKEGTLALFTSDMSMTYRPRPFEMAMVPYYKALNYIYLGQPNEAQVEARRSSEMLAQYVDATLEGLRKEDRAALESVRADAFMLYFAGMLYDWDGEWNDAFISYRNAATAFQANRDVLGLEIPPSLAQDLARTGQRLGFGAELEELRKSCPAVFAVVDTLPLVPSTPQEYEDALPADAGRGQLVVLLEEGYLPLKTQGRLDLPIFKDEAYDDPNYWAWEMADDSGELHAMAAGHSIEYWLAVAVPQMMPVPRTISQVRVSTAALGSHSVTRQVENLNNVAMLTFEAEKPTIYFRTFVRGLLKYLATRGVQKKAGGLGGFAANLLGAATERADTRSWLTLPRAVHLARLTLPAGEHEVKLEVLDSRGRPVDTQLVPGVTVRNGGWTFLSRRVF